MEQVNRLIDSIERLTSATESRGADSYLLVKEIESRDRLVERLQEEVKNTERNLADQLAQLRAQHAEAIAISDWAVKLNGEVESKQAELMRMSDWAVHLQRDLASKHQELLQMSDWAAPIARAPLRYAVRRYSYRVLQLIYRILPLSKGVKVAVKARLRKNKAAPLTLPQTTPEILPGVSTDLVTDPSPLSFPAGPGVLMFGVIDWHFRIQRPQNLAKELAKTGLPTYYISNHFIDNESPGYKIEIIDAATKLYQVSFNVHGAPAIYYSPPQAEVIQQLCRGLAMLLLAEQLNAVDCIVQHSYWFPLARRIPNSMLIYDCMDHHEGFGDVAQEMLDLELALMRRADLLIATSDWIEQHAKRQNANVKIIRNAGEYDFFSRRPTEVYTDPANRRIIGYYGAIAEWFDIELVRQVAESFQDHLVLLIGNDTVGAKNLLSTCPNIIFEGEVPYGSLPYYLYAIDVCLLPFKVIPLTLATNPVKVYEYLSAGKPVVSVKLPELEQFGHLVSSAQNPEEFLAAIQNILNDLPEQKQVAHARQRFAEGQTWRHRANSLRKAIQNTKSPKVSVVVLTYNNLELTKSCLDSIVKNSHYDNLEIIVVDNSSTDDTPAYLHQWAADHTNRIIILNEDNKGFSAGNNIGLAAATGEYLVILNNDTVVTTGWIKGLIRHLKDNDDIGIIGPITNNIGNEAKVSTRYTTLEEMHHEAAEIIHINMGNWFEINTLAFFCVMLPRATYERLGGLCEEYGLGFFEDDDYCRQVQKSGMRAACAEDVFVHHHLSASFNKLGIDAKKELFEKNKATYEKKWGTWAPHAYREI